MTIREFLEKQPGNGWRGYIYPEQEVLIDEPAKYERKRVSRGTELHIMTFLNQDLRVNGIEFRNCEHMYTFREF